ncbi:MAG: OmpA family protein [Elusimicrobiota bacterium]
MRSIKELIFVVAAVMAVLPWAHGQDDDARSSLSRPMQTAVRFYEQGDDVQAMDRFMEILTQGDPTERSMANEYINLITHRMNSNGGAGGNPAAPRPGAVTAEPVPAAPGEKLTAPVISEGKDGPGRPSRLDSIDEVDTSARKPKPAAERSPRGEELSAANGALMRKEIKARLHAAQERSIADLKAIDGVRVAMRENGDPEAIGVPSPLLFQAGISFQRDASRLLDPLTKLVFALGSTQVLILPEGTGMGDAKVLDMRRTMGISSALYQAGVAPPRVRVNLLNTQVDIPKSFLDFKGVVVVFQYDQPMTLSIDSAVGDELGPPISLGVFPAQIRPSRNQGAIIEFSVSDPPAGLVSWKFQLLQPSKDGSELSPLREAVGGGPVFHQIFWNGRQNYFGEPLAPGRYECVLTALDAKNRQRTLHKWIQVLAEEGDGEKLLASGAALDKSGGNPIVIEKAPAVAAPVEDLGASSKPLVNGVKPAAAKGVEIAAAPKAKSKPKVVRRGVRAKKASKGDKGKSAKTAEPKPAADSSAGGDAASTAAPEAAAKAGHYALAFGKNTHQLTPDSEKSLAKAVSDLSSYPLETLQVVGHAASDETNADALAADRAKLVASLLVNRYQVDPKKIAMSSGAGGAATVELVLARNN